MFFLKKEPKTFFVGLRGKTLRKLCCARSFSRCARHPLVSSSSAAKDLGRNSLEDDACGARTTHNDFFCILARRDLSCLTYVSHLLAQNRKQKKIRATSVDRVAGEIYSLHYIKDVEDVRNAIFPLLPDEPFGREELSKSLKLKGLKLWSAQKLLTETNLLSCEKQGNKLIFNKR